eukprot:1738609-Rhodomonas_salina.1
MSHSQRGCRFAPPFTRLELGFAQYARPVGAHLPTCGWHVCPPAGGVCTPAGHVCPLFPRLRCGIIACPLASTARENRAGSASASEPESRTLSRDAVALDSDQSRDLR